MQSSLQTNPVPLKEYIFHGTDQDIYKERKALGAYLMPYILQSINNDLKHTVFSYIPNTALVAFNGLIDALRQHGNAIKKKRLLEEKENLTPDLIEDILSYMPRFEQIAVKDAKLRTFITQDNQRDEMVTHIYDITYGTIEKDMDNLVVLDDSIVRGTTLKQVLFACCIVCIHENSSSLRRPSNSLSDCYGIDMSRLGDFVAFQAAIALLKTHQEQIIDEVYRKAKEQENYPKKIANYVKIFMRFYI